MCYGVFIKRQTKSLTNGLIIHTKGATDPSANKIPCVFQAEARLAAKRAARAEAREIRMKELERQQKEVRLVVLCGFLSQVFSFWVERAGAETPVAIYTPVRLTVLTIGMRRACDCCSRSGQGVRIARMPGMPVPDLDLLGPETASRAATRLPTSSPAFWPKGAKSCWF